MAHKLQTDDEAAESRTVAVGIDETYRALADEQRRAVLRVVEETAPPLSLDKLATAVAAETEAEETERVRLELHHKHLPLLADVGALDYDPETQRVTDCHLSISQHLD